jgi:hypothetical protein
MLHFKRYQKSKSKRIEDILFLVMDANRLREWIAPEYSPSFKNKIPMPPPQAAVQRFCISIFDIDFMAVNGLCNHVKDLNPRHGETSCLGSSGLCVDDWNCMINDVPNWGEGFPAGFCVDGEGIGAVLHRFLGKYRDD